MALLCLPLHTGASNPCGGEDLIARHQELLPPHRRVTQRGRSPSNIALLRDIVRRAMLEVKQLMLDYVSSLLRMTKALKLRVTRKVGRLKLQGELYQTMFVLKHTASAY